MFHRKSTISEEINMKLLLFNCYEKFDFENDFVQLIVMCMKLIYDLY